MSFVPQQPIEERLFQAALGLPPEDRDAFVCQAAGEDAELLDVVRKLLSGWEQAGGDGGDATLGEGGTAWMATAAEEPGMVIDQFRLLRKLGEGGMGTVWEADQIHPVKRKVALKVIKLGMDTVEVVKRFERERQSLARMNHPNIAQVYQAGATVLGRPYFAMELVAGEPITEHCRQRELSVPERLGLFIAVCGAVEHAHQKGIIHRDLKPTNILVAADGPKVIDFGVAKATRDPGCPESLFTRESQMLGTPAYMSPEQAASEGMDVDTRTDVYALGAVLYEILCGSPPFDAKLLQSSNPAAIQRILAEEEPVRPSTRLRLPPRNLEPPEIRGKLRGDLDWVVMKALAKERERRYASAEALAEDLRCFLRGEAVSAAPPSTLYQLRKSVGKHRLAAAVTGIVLLALAYGLIISMLQTGRANRALAGQAQARFEATMAVADLYTRSGLVEADKGEKDLAALWFANAAVLAAEDEDRVRVNRLRTAAWRQDTTAAVRAFDTGFLFVWRMQWEPGGPALLMYGQYAGNEARLESQIWDIDSETRWYPRPAVPLREARWSPLGGLLAASSEEDLVVIAYPSGEERARLPGVGECSFSWSPDGRWIGVTSSLASNFLWEPASGKRIAVDPPGADLVGIKFSPGDRRLLCLCHGHRIGVVEVADPGRWLFPPVRLGGWDADFLGPHGEAFFGAHVSGDVEVRDSATGTLLQKWEGEADVGEPAVASSDGRFIARRSLPLIDRENSENNPLDFPRHQNSFSAFAFSSDGRFLASGSYDNTAKLWQLPSGEFLGDLGYIRFPVLSLAFSPDDRFLATSKEGLVRVWRLHPEPVFKSIPLREPSLAVLSPDGRLVAPAGLSQYVGRTTSTRIYDSLSGEPRGPEIVPGGVIVGAAFGPRGEWLALAVSTIPAAEREKPQPAVREGGFVGRWDTATGKLLEPPFILDAEPRAVAIHPRDTVLAVLLGNSRLVEIDWEKHTSKTLFDLQRDSPPLATLNNGRCVYTGDGRFLVTWGLEHLINFWNREEERLHDFSNDSTWQVLALDVSPANEVAYGIIGGSTRVGRFDLDAARSYPELPMTNWPLLVRFNPAGDEILLGGANRMAQLFLIDQFHLNAGPRQNDFAPRTG